MVDELELNTYLFISPSEFGIYLLNTKDFKNLYENKIQIRTENNEINLIILNEFLEENIFKIEKLIGGFIKNIYLIIESDKIINVNLCPQNKNYDQNINQNNLKNILTDAKDLFKENYREYKIMHMVINELLLDGSDYPKILGNIKTKEFNLEIEFLAVPNDLIIKIEDVLKNYQIKLTKHLSKIYLQNLFNLEETKLSIQAHKIINGYNENEVSLVSKKLKKQGFFEKFFQLFS